MELEVGKSNHLKVEEKDIETYWQSIFNFNFVRSMASVKLRELFVK